ncbi:MAG: alpha/beta hydrolase [Humibacillus sp.]|nr:alpha/beta hydrolase [Humibacillus sp.]MDN5777068.1 alpha/beta hydrolase [Humibacillus sp.]
MRPRPDPALPRHPPEIQSLHDKALAGTGVRSRFVRTDDGAALHLLESGSGPPVILVHGSMSAGLFWMPLLSHLQGVHTLAPDRPGQGLSDPVDLPKKRIREAAVAWLDRVLDALELPAATLVGHSMGGLWSLWFAMAKPERVDRLVMLGTPTLPGTRAPLPFRMLATPGLGALIERQRQTPTSVRRFATMMGEGEAITGYPDLIELMVATGRDPVAQAVGRPEVRTIVSPLALFTRSGFRRSMRVRHDELGRLSMPTLLMWGEHDPLATVEMARRSIASLPRARLEHFPGGHLPFLDVPEDVADGLNAFFDEQPSRAD